MSLIEFCREFVAIDSSPANGSREVAEFVGNYAESVGFQVDYQYGVEGGQPQANVFIRPKSVSIDEDSLLFISHLDTPDPGNYALWTQTFANPFKASQHGDQLYGLGVAGPKIDFICKLLAFEKYVDANFKTPIVLCGCYGGHSDMTGVKQAIRHQKFKANSAIVGYPTEESICFAGSGFTEVQVRIPFSDEEINYHRHHDEVSSSSQSKMFSGKAAHSTHPQLGENAIVKMIDYLSSLPEGIALMSVDGGVSANTVPPSAFLEVDFVADFKETVVGKIKKVMELLRGLERDFAKHKAEDFEPQVSTLNLGQIRCEHDSVVLIGSCRILPSVSEDIYESWMRDLDNECKKMGAEFHITSHVKSFSTDEDSSLINVVSESLPEIGSRASKKKMTVCTEAHVLSRFGVESIVWGVGRGAGNTHQPNEHIQAQDLERARQFYEKLIEINCI